MGDPIPKSVKKIWDNWNIRGVILFSLTLQTLLVLFAPLRKGTANKLIILLLWSAYLLADWSANFAVGLISDSQSDAPDPHTSKDNSDLLALWAPFLLLHLGGPDTITAFALEDNELWLRHLLGLVFQAAAAVYVFLQSLKPNKLIASTLLMFLAGFIKYIERTRALYLASLDRFRDSMLEEPDPGPNYAKLMEEFASKKEAKLPTKIIMIPEPVKEANASDNGNVTEVKLTDLDVVHYAYKYFNIFKGLIVDLIFSFHVRNERRAFFGKLVPEDALRVIEVELNFIYETLYTKVEVVHSVTGYVARFISFSSVVAALSLFYFHVRKSGFDAYDVRITYVLFLGAVGLDTIAFFMLIFSDRTFASLVNEPGKQSRIAAILDWVLILKKPRWYECSILQNSIELKHNILARPFLLRRWSGSVSGHNLVRYCLKGRPTKFYKVESCLHFPSIVVNQGIDKVIHLLRIDKLIDCFGLTDYVDEIIYVSRDPFAKELWEFIFHELKRKPELADKPEDAKRISSAKGDWVLQDSKGDSSKLMPYVADVAYDESILLWHIATELLYQTTDGEVTSNDREFSKVLSDYMLYLLIMQPTMMSAVAGIGKIRFRDTCAEAKRFFERKNLKSDQEKLACKKILAVNTFVVPVSVKGDKSKSVLFDASMLAKELKEFEKKEKQDKWKIMSEVWVEMLSFAASHCIARTHAQQVSKGGELISFVWLLMAHFGLGEQFKINKGQGRTKLIVAK